MAQKTIKKSLALLTTLCLVVSLSLTCFVGCEKNTETDKTVAKSVSVTIVYEDKTEEKIELNTEAEFLADALVEKGIIEYDKDGYYTTVKGVTADYNKDQAWWCVTKGGEMTNEGLNTLAISDGDTYEITYTIG